MVLVLLFVDRIGVRLRTWRSRIDGHGVGGGHNSPLVDGFTGIFGVSERAAQTAANRPIQNINTLSLSFLFQSISSTW